MGVEKKLRARRRVHRCVDFKSLEFIIILLNSNSLFQKKARKYMCSNKGHTNTNIIDSLSSGAVGGNHTDLRIRSKDPWWWCVVSRLFSYKVVHAARTTL